MIQQNGYGGLKPDIWNYYNSDESNHILTNRAISSVYAPGSTYKMVTAVAALQTNNVTTTEKINDVGIYTIGYIPGNKQPKCWIYDSTHRGHGYLNVSNAIKHSCNYFFYEMGVRMGIDTLDRYAKAFGLGTKTNIELLSEVSGTRENREIATATGDIWTEGRVLNAAIGQGNNAFTPIQMAKYLSILVNGGKQVNPTIVKTVINSDGTEIKRKDMENSVNSRIGNQANTEQNIEISRENLDAVMDGMKGVTSEVGGTAYGVFRNFNIEVGGKTGTAQKGEKDTPNALFVGFAPYDNPEIAVVCVIENGGNSSIASYPARDVIAQYFGMNEQNIEENTRSFAKC